MIVARLAGPLPVQLVEVSSWNATSRWWCVSTDPVLADQATEILRGCVRAGQAGDGEGGLAGDLAGAGVLAPAVILMTCRAAAKSRRLTWAVLRVRVSVRPCPASRPIGVPRRAITSGAARWASRSLGPH
jgi:hypothetical protein